MSAESTFELLRPLLGSSEAAAMFADRARVQGMLDFEAALARAEARLDIIPAAAAPTIVKACRAELFDVSKLAVATTRAGNPAIPLVKQLTALVAAESAEAARYVHWGATSQDAMDTGLVLQLRSLLALIDRDLARLAGALARLADIHRKTPAVGRTWMQHALPITFGLRVAGWLDAIDRHRQRLAQLRPRVLTLQFGGAAGTLAALGEQGLSVAEALAKELDLALPMLPWHANRDRIVEVAAVLGLIVGTLGKMARDVSLLTLNEIGEAAEPADDGRGGSSTMPHKHNPVTAAIVLAAAVRAPGLVATMMVASVQEQERGLGGWHAEWETLPELCMLAAGALRQMTETIGGLKVDASRMRANLDLTHGLILAEAVMMALGDRIGRLAAHDLVEEGCRRAIAERRHLKDVLAKDPRISRHLGADDLDRLFDPLGYVGMASRFVDRVLAQSRSK